MRNVKGINRYLSVGVDANWIKNYFKDNKYEPGNRKTDTMFSFLDDANVTKKRQFTSFGKKIIEIGIQKEISWELMLCNLAYSVPFRWYIENIPFNEAYELNRLDLDMEDATKKARGEFWNGFKVILDSNEIFQQIGLGNPDITVKVNKNGEEKKSMNFLQRKSWDNPEPLVILYSLYKFAEHCGYYDKKKKDYVKYCQFSLTTLLDDTIERDGVSPTRIFGLSREVMIPLLNGLSANYPEYINVSFTLGLDTITLREDKKSEDVLELF